MDTADPELSAMSEILGILDQLPNLGAKIRVVHWLYDRYAAQETAATADLLRANDSASSQEAPRPAHDRVSRRDTVVSFLQDKQPTTKTERFVCLLFWATEGDDRGAPVKTLNLLNRMAGGDAFSSAGSIGQHAVASGYARQGKAGHFALTADGLDLVASLPRAGYRWALQ